MRKVRQRKAKEVQYIIYFKPGLCSLQGIAFAPLALLEMDRHGMTVTSAQGLIKHIHFEILKKKNHSYTGRFKEEDTPLFETDVNF